LVFNNAKLSLLEGNKKLPHGFHEAAHSVSGQEVLFRMNCFNRAHICACATFGAHFRIDFVNVAFGDSFNGAFVDASTASSAIFTYFVSHDDINFSSTREGVNNLFSGQIY